MSKTVETDARGYRIRPCCGTTYNCEHYNDCPTAGADVMAALPCDIVEPDGWCFNHSTGAGAVFCEREKATP